MKYTKKAIEFVTEMLPHDGAVGVDIDSAAFKDMLNEYVDPDDTIAKAQLIEEVRQLLAFIGQNGFAVLSLSY